jgi:hypothetical protein
MRMLAFFIHNYTAYYFLSSARFNYHLTHPANQFDDLHEQTRYRLLGGEGHFDARVVPCPDHSVLVDTIFWRSNFDAFRNSISQISFSLFSKKVEGSLISFRPNPNLFALL